MIHGNVPGRGVVVALVLVLAAAGGGACFGYDVLQDEFGHVVKWESTDIPVTYYVNTSGMPSLPNALGAIVAGFSAWEAVSSSDITFTYGGTISAVGSPARDGINLVMWLNDLSSYTDATAGGDLERSIEEPEGGILLVHDVSAVVAMPFAWYSTIDGRLLEFDIAFNTGAAIAEVLPAPGPGEGEEAGSEPIPWSTTPDNIEKVDMQGMATHMAGHFIGLDHSMIKSACMYYTVSVDDTFDLRTLHSDDVEAASSLYPVPGMPFSQPGPSGRSGGCFIATAAYGTPMASEVKALSDVRDEFLLKSEAGRAAVAFYEKTSPPVAGVIGRHPVARCAVRAMLMPVVGLTRAVRAQE